MKIFLRSILVDRFFFLLFAESREQLAVIYKGTRRRHFLKHGEEYRTRAP